MDILCPNCGEPTDIDTLHEAVAEECYPSFDEARKAFYAIGCRALNCIGIVCSEPLKPGASNVLREVYELLGDDIDGAACLIEDALADGSLSGLLD